MNRQVLLLLVTLLLIAALAGCGGEAPSPAPSAAPPQYAAETAEGEYSYAGDGGLSPQKAGAADLPSSGTENAAPMAVADKIIYSAEADIETLDFDATLQAVEALISRAGGFLEQSAITGSNYSHNRDHRSANYTIRIPASSFFQVTESLSDLGNVVYCHTNAENITSQYQDTAARLAAEEIQYDRLLEMLAKCETVEEMLAIESRLSNVRYEIESLTTTISGWDSLINYSTLRLAITEVRDLTVVADTELSYWQEVGQGLQDSLRGVGNFFSNLLKAFIISLPVIAVLAVLAAVALIVRKQLLTRREKKNSPPTTEK